METYLRNAYTRLKRKLGRQPTLKVSEFIKASRDNPDFKFQWDKYVASEFSKAFAPALRIIDGALQWGAPQFEGKGIYQSKSGRRFMARICIDGKDIYLGAFDSEEKARLARELHLKAVRPLTNLEKSLDAMVL